MVSVLIYDRFSLTTFSPASPPFEARGSDCPYHKQVFSPRYGQPASSWLVTQKYLNRQRRAPILQGPIFDPPIVSFSATNVSEGRCLPSPARLPICSHASTSSYVFDPSHMSHDPSFLLTLSPRPQPWPLPLPPRFLFTALRPRKQWLFAKLTASLMDN